MTLYAQYPLLHLDLNALQNMVVSVSKEEKPESPLHKHIIRLVIISIRTWIWIAALMFTRVIKQCDHRAAGEGHKDEPEGLISNREEQGPEKLPQSVTR